MTATIAALIEALATFGGAVPGIAHSYDPANTPEEATPDILPFALTLPVGMKFATHAFQGGAPELKVKATQTIYYMPSDGVPFYQAFRPNEGNGVTLAAGILTLADNYYAALKLTPFLAALTSPPPVHMPAVLDMPFGIAAYAGINYHVLEFTFDLQIFL